MNQKTLTYIAEFSILYVFKDEIINMSKGLLYATTSVFFHKISINKIQSSRTIYALEQYIKESYKNEETIASDGRDDVDFDLNCQGIFWLTSLNFSGISRFWFWISFNDEEYVNIYCNSAIPYADFKECLSLIYKKYIQTQTISFFYISNKDKWNTATTRIPRSLDTIRITDPMKILFDDVDNFKKSALQYQKNGETYKRCYFLIGKPRTGKTTSVEYISIKYNMPIYEVYINYKDACDSDLVNLIAKVPSNSILVFEEISRQLQTLKNGSNTDLTEAGVLACIDGPHRMPHGVIVIFTANSEIEMNPKFLEAFTREGRRDLTIDFN